MDESRWHGTMDDLAAIEPFAYDDADAGGLYRPSDVDALSHGVPCLL
jgi:hypothetical protein